ncbi:MAG: DNA-directed RNA polymerase subunit delta [Bacilli bacterium]|nr:DNA-directed RNA polymerase subunit delta [Bacilli bacterium]
MKIKLTDEEIETMSYDDVAYLILKKYGKKMETLDLFKKVIKIMKLNDDEYNKGIGDFFELLLTDKRFIMLESGYWDLKTNHRANIIIDDTEDEDFDFNVDEEEDEKEIEKDDTKINYDEDTDNDDDDDELENLVIISDQDDSDDKL